MVTRLCGVQVKAKANGGGGGGRWEGGGEAGGKLWNLPRIVPKRGGGIPNRNPEFIRGVLQQGEPNGITNWQKDYFANSCKMASLTVIRAYHA